MPKISKTKIKKLIPIVILFIICLVLLFVYRTPPKQTTTPTTNFLAQKNISISNQTNHITLEINNINYVTEIRGETNVYNVMQQLQNEQKITFKEKNYIGMGEFIEEINGIKNTDDKNWIYYVNNKKASIGVSNYKINKGDIISWRYEK